jgi:hypothetical protein
VADENVVWISADPRVELDADGVEYTFVSKACCKTMRMSRARARKTANAVLALLDAEQRKPSAVVPIKGRQRAH